MQSVGFCILAWPLAPTMTPGECPPGGGGRGSAKQEAAPHAALTISLVTAAAKLLVGGFFLAFWVGVFF